MLNTIQPLSGGFVGHGILLSCPLLAVQLLSPGEGREGTEQMLSLQVVNEKEKEISNVSEDLMVEIFIKRR